MEKEELTTMLRNAVLGIIKENCTSPEVGLESLHEVMLNITLATGEVLVGDSKTFAIDILKQDIEIVKKAKF